MGLLAQKSVLFGAMFQDPSLTPVGGSSLEMGAGPWWDVEVTNVYCATLGLRVGRLFF